MFKKLLQAGAKIGYDRYRRSVYYWAYKLENVAIIRLIESNVEQSLLYELQLNTLHYLGEDNNPDLRQKLYAKVMKTHKKDDEELDVALANYSDALDGIESSKERSTDIALDIRTELSTPQLTKNEQSYYDIAARGDHFTLKHNRKRQPESFYRVLAHALANNDFVAFFNIFPHALKQTTLVQDVFINKHLQLLNIIIVMGGDVLNLSNQLINQALQNILPQHMANSDAKHEPSRADEKHSSVQLQDNRPANLLQQFLKQYWSIGGLVQNLFTTENNSQFKNFVFLLAHADDPQIKKGKQVRELLRNVKDRQIRDHILQQFFIFYQDKFRRTANWLQTPSNGISFDDHLKFCADNLNQEKNRELQPLYAAAESWGLTAYERVVSPFVRLLSRAKEFSTSQKVNNEGKFEPVSLFTLWDLARLSVVSREFAVQFGSDAVKSTVTLKQKREELALVNSIFIAMNAQSNQIIRKQKIKLGLLFSVVIIVLLGFGSKSLDNLLKNLKDVGDLSRIVSESTI